jgi:precorrin-8X/cobalt-precorrin-8 methylmutase
VIGMPVGFVGVEASKQRLAASGLPQIRLEGSRGGAGLVAAAINALLRRGWLEDIENG